MEFLGFLKHSWLPGPLCIVQRIASIWQVGTLSKTSTNVPGKMIKGLKSIGNQRFHCCYLTQDSDVGIKVT